MWIKDIYGNLVNLKNRDEITISRMTDGRVQVTATRWIHTPNGDLVVNTIFEGATEQEASTFLDTLLAKLNRVY